MCILFTGYPRHRRQFSLQVVSLLKLRGDSEQDTGFAYTAVLTWTKEQNQLNELLSLSVNFESTEVLHCIVEVLYT